QASFTAAHTPNIFSARLHGLVASRRPPCSVLPSRLYLLSRWSHELDWDGVGYSRSVATGGSARVATAKRRGDAGADRIGQDLHLRAALSEPENPGGVHRPDARTC